MGAIIVQHHGRYNVYSTISDQFWFKKSVTEEELTKALKEDAVRVALEQFEMEIHHRLDRAKASGSSGHGRDLEKTLLCNRAGANEYQLSVDECIRRFLS